MKKGKCVGQYSLSVALADIVYKTIAFIVLTPLVELFFSVVLSVSGNEVLADQDILFFFLGPAGWLCSITVGALWLGIVALEQSAESSAPREDDSRLESWGL